MIRICVSWQTNELSLNPRNFTVPTNHYFERLCLFLSCYTYKCLFLNILFISEGNVKILRWKQRTTSSEHKTPKNEFKDTCHGGSIRREAANTFMPPKPMPTSWDTWLEAVRILKLLKKQRMICWQLMLTVLEQCKQFQGKMKPN